MCAAAILAAANGERAGAASDPGAAAPIQLDKVKIDPILAYDQTYAYPGLITVSFTNTDAKTIDEVTFGLRDAYGHLVEQYRDRGPFAPNAAVRNHRFTDTQLGADQTLAVDAVRFHDGSMWYPGPVAARRQATEAAVSGAAR